MSRLMAGEFIKEEASPLWMAFIRLGSAMTAFRSGFCENCVTTAIPLPEETKLWTLDESADCKEEVPDCSAGGGVVTGVLGVPVGFAFRGAAGAMDITLLVSIFMSPSVGDLMR